MDIHCLCLPDIPRSSSSGNTGLIFLWENAPFPTPTPCRSQEVDADLLAPEGGAINQVWLINGFLSAGHTDWLMNGHVPIQNDTRLLGFCRNYWERDSPFAGLLKALRTWTVLVLTKRKLTEKGQGILTQKRAQEQDRFLTKPTESHPTRGLFNYMSQ